MTRMFSVLILSVALGACADAERDRVIWYSSFIDGTFRNNAKASPPKIIKVLPNAIELPVELDQKSATHIDIDFRNLGDDISFKKIEIDIGAAKSSYRRSLDLRFAAATRNAVAGAIAATSESVTEFAPPAPSKHRVIPAINFDNFRVIIRPFLTGIHLTALSIAKKSSVSARIHVRFDMYSARGRYQRYETFAGKASIEVADGEFYQAVQRVIAAALENLSKDIAENLPTSKSVLQIEGI